MDLTELEKDLPELERRIFKALRSHPAGLRRGQLVAIAFNESVKAGDTTNNNTRDRKVRMAIAALRSRMVPIVSTSRQAGYKLDTTDEGRKAMLAELISRRNKLDDMITRVSRFYGPAPESMPERETATQGRLV